MHFMFVGCFALCGEQAEKEAGIILIEEGVMFGSSWIESTWVFHYGEEVIKSA